jgi:hypothetical protein
MLPKSLLPALLLLGTIGAIGTSAAQAEASVYLNGTNVDNAVINAKMERCTVTFDGKGNVMISAPGYQVESVQSPPTDGPTPNGGVAVASALGKKYFVVSEQSLPGMTQYDIDLYVNSKWVRKFHSDDEQIVTEVTQFMHPGPNKVLFVAKKNVVGTRKSFSPDATYRITLGEGEATGDKVVIDNPLVSFKRSADQSEDTSQEFAVTGR